MVNPPINDLYKCLAILMLRTAKCKHDEVAQYIGKAKKNIGDVEKWFRELNYEEAISVCFDHAVDCTRVLELDHLKGWVQKENQQRLDKMDATSVLGRYCHVKIKEKKASILHPRPSEHHARLASAAEKLRLNIKRVKQVKGTILVGNITQGHIKTRTLDTEQELQNVDRLDAACLLSHLKAMYPEFQKIENWENLDTRKSVSQISGDMIQKLKKVSHGTAIESTCEICESWT